MADRYWVGGTGGAWTATSTTNWSATSGGAAGASAPTSADNVFFDTLSGLTTGGTVIITGGVCANLTYTPTAAVGQRSFNITDSLTISGTLSTSGTAGNVRLRIRPATIGIATNMSVAALGSISDIDFLDVYVTGAAAPLTGTRLGNIANGRGVTFSTPKTVYWNLAGTQNWSSDGWCATSGGTPSTDNFPLVQDTAVFDNAGAITTITMNNAAFLYYGNIDMSSRTSAMTISTGVSNQIYGNWTNGSGTAFSGTASILFQGRTTQTITSAGKTWLAPISINTFGGVVQLGGAINTGTQTLTVTSGSFITNGNAVTTPSITSNTTVPRSISLGASNVTFTSTTAQFIFTAGSGLTFDAGTSTVNLPATTTAFPGLGFTYYNVAVASGTTSITVTGANTFNNLTVAGARTLSFDSAQTFTGSLVYTGTATTRLTVLSSVVGTPRTLTINGAFVSNDIDFRDIAVAGTAAPISNTRLGDWGGNSGITFTSKTVYWNLAGAQGWAAVGWALTSGGTPALDNFPLPQDTAVFDDAGAAGTVSFVSGYIYPTIDMSARTIAMTLATVAANINGSWTNGSGTTLSGTANLIFNGRGTQTITSAGKTFTQQITVGATGSGTTVVLTDALVTTSTSGLTVASGGTFNAVTFNVTTTVFSTSGTVYMGSGLWTLTASGTVWIGGGSLYQGTANILLSNNTTAARTFTGGSLSYNKLTIGGNTSTSTTTLNGTNTFTELASTKTVAHTVALSTSQQIFGAWTITGTAGNVVTVTGAGTHGIAGSRVSGVDYLALGTTTFAIGFPGEFYAGANSTGTGVGVILTAAPAPVTRYWVGGTGTWSTTNTANWSATSGGAGGASVPTSVDSVTFDSASNATAYTVTCTAAGATLRAASLTMGAPLAGNITWAGTGTISLFGNTALTGGASITRTYTGAILLSGATIGNTLNTNGVTLGSAISVFGINSGWALTSSLNIGSPSLTISYGSLDTAGYAVTAGSITSNTLAPRAISLGASAVSLSVSTPLIFGTAQNLTLNAGTSSISVTNAGPTFNGTGLTYYNVSFTSATITSLSITGANTFNDLTISRSTAGVLPVTFSANQTINGVLTRAGVINPLVRVGISSSSIGTTRTFTINSAASITDFDFQDIAVVGTAAPISGTRLGDWGGNSGITFTSKTVYWNLAGSNAWTAIGWAATSGGTPNSVNFPLAQDTAVFDESGAAGTITISTVSYAYPAIDMSARTTAMTLATGANTVSLYGDWTNGSGTTVTGTGTLAFVKRTGTQTITSAGKTFTQGITPNSINGTVVLADALVTNLQLGFGPGTFDAASYNVTAATVTGSVVTTARTVSMGSGTWTLTGTGTVWDFSVVTGLTLNKDTANIVLSDTSTTSRTFAGGGLAYNKLTIGGATGVSILTVTGNNTFSEIASTKTVASTLVLGSTIQTVGAWTASGTAGNLLLVAGTSSAAPAYLVLTTGVISSDYLSIANVRATPLDGAWYAGANSTNGGSLGWIFTALSGNTYLGTVTELATATDAIEAFFAFLASVSETATGTDTVDTAAIFNPAVAETTAGTDALSTTAAVNPKISETATGTDALSSLATFYATTAENASALDAVLAGLTYVASMNEVATAVDSLLSGSGYFPVVSETVTATDTPSSQVVFLGATSETATATDDAATSVLFFAIVPETTAATDDLTAKAVFSALAAEAATATDDINAPGSTYNTAVLVAVTITDGVIGAYLWNPIDDSQTPNWQNVVNTQGSGWTLIPTPQNPNWTDVET